MDRQAILEAQQYHARRLAHQRQVRERLRQERYQSVRAAIQRLAPGFPAIEAVYLFGSLVRPGLHRPDSDIDVAVHCDSVEIESQFWQALEHELQRDVDVRPFAGAIAEAIRLYGECIYERKVSPP